MRTAQDIADSVAAAQRPLLPIGAGTKTALAYRTSETDLLPTAELQGIVSYDPSEFLITARAGTSVLELQQVLEAKGQYLPFDPLFVRRAGGSSGSTIGGSVASGLSGPGRLLYGGLRDFVMEVELVDGLGRLIRGGGKVVKNAAGFDFPKLLVGSYGRLGVLTEITLKVFPKPQSSATLLVDFHSLAQCLQAVQSLLAQPLPVAAVDLVSRSAESSAGYRLMARFSGPSDSLLGVLARARQAMGKAPQASHIVRDAEPEAEVWQQQADRIQAVAHMPDTLLIRAATNLPSLVDLVRGLEGFPCSLQHSAAGAVTWIALRVGQVEGAPLEALDRKLADLAVAAVAICGPVPLELTSGGGLQSLCLLGDRRWLPAAKRIARAIDPQRRFAEFPQCSQQPSP